jgi:hypothetical protein
MKHRFDFSEGILTIIAGGLAGAAAALLLTRPLPRRGHVPITQRIREGLRRARNRGVRVGPRPARESVF